MDERERFEARRKAEITDELNPEFLFAMTSTDLLTQIARGEIDARELAIKQLAGRGVDPESGAWIGFERAHEAAQNLLALLENE